MSSLGVTRFRQAGLGMVEILVGMLIGMIGVVVIFSVLAIAEERKRSTGAGSDAQTAGAIALYTLERDVRQAGFGLVGTAFDFYGCPVAIFNSARSPQEFTATLAPVRITQGAAGAPDTITVWYGSSSTGPITKQFIAPSTTESKTLSEGVGGLLENDLVLLAGDVPGATGCPGGSSNAVAMVQVSDVSNATGVVMDHAAGRPFNRSGGPNVPAPFTAGFVFNLGPQPVINQWSVNANGTLQVQDLLRLTSAVQIGESIVDLQAQYGINTAAANATPIIEWQDADPSAAQWPNVRAIRVAILTRSANWERDEVTPNPPRWYDDAADDYVEFTMSDLPDGTSWKHYRYRVFQTTIPLPNVVMGTGI